MIFFVTGGSRGIGAAIVLEAVRQGHDVAFTYRTRRDCAEDVVAAARDIDPTRTVRPYAMDLRSSAAVDEVGDRVLADFETMDVVVANAGINHNGLVVSMTDDEWQTVLDTNLTGTFYVCRHFLTTLLANGFGRIVIVSSLGHSGSSGQAAYAASKAGLLGLSATLAKEYGRKGITSNVVVPGVIDTELARDDMSQANRDFWLRHCPLRRVGHVDEVAGVVLFLASPAAAYTNGQAIAVNGGLGWAP